MVPLGCMIKGARRDVIDRAGFGYPAPVDRRLWLHRRSTEHKVQLNPLRFSLWMILDSTCNTLSYLSLPDYLILNIGA